MCRGAQHVLADHQAEAEQEASGSRLEGGPQEGKNVLPLGVSGGLRAARAHNGMAWALTRAHDALCFAQERLCIVQPRGTPAAVSRTSRPWVALRRPSSVVALARFVGSGDIQRKIPTK